MEATPNFRFWIQNSRNFYKICISGIAPCNINCRKLSFFIWKKKSGDPFQIDFFSLFLVPKQFFSALWDIVTCASGYPLWVNEDITVERLSQLSLRNECQWITKIYLQETYYFWQKLLCKGRIIIKFGESNSENSKLLSSPLIQFKII